jgi:hypothetical protein
MMKGNMNRHFLLSGLLTCIWAGMGVAPAAPVTLTLDSAQSTLTLSGTFVNSQGQSLALTEQSSGSLIAHLQGNALVDATLTAIGFQVEADALELPGAYAPPGLHGMAMEPADLAGQVLNPVPDEQGLYAVRDLLMTLATLTVARDAQGRFPVTTALGIVTAERPFFVGTPGEGGTTFHPSGTIFENNESSLLGQFEQVGSLLVFTLPVELPWSIPTLSSDLQATSGRLTGQIVATALVPEPTTWTLLLSGVALVWCVRRRAR